MNSLAKRIVSSVTALVLAASGATVFSGVNAENTVTAAGSYNYAEALQK